MEPSTQENTLAMNTCVGVEEASWAKGEVELQSSCNKVLSQPYRKLDGPSKSSPHQPVIGCGLAPVDTALFI